MVEYFRLLCMPSNGWNKPPIIMYETKDTSENEYIIMLDELPWGCEQIRERNSKGEEYFINKGFSGHDFYKIEIVRKNL